jgi:cobalt-zinc-cadmium efflux system protein
MRADQGNLNIKSAFIHMLTDALSSVAIIVGLIVIWYTGWEWIDALLAVIVSAVILKWSWELLRDSMHILLEGSPVDVGKVTAHVLQHYPEVVDVHDVHVWQISQRFNCLTAHLHIHPDAIFGYPALVDRLNEDLREQFGIGHTNFQPEWRS